MRALFFQGSGVITKKSGHLEIEAYLGCGEIENSNKLADFACQAGPFRY